MFAQDWFTRRMSRHSRVAVIHKTIWGALQPFPHGKLGGVFMSETQRRISEETLEEDSLFFLLFFFTMIFPSSTE